MSIFLLPALHYAKRIDVSDEEVSALG